MYEKCSLKVNKTFFKSKQKEAGIKVKLPQVFWELFRDTILEIQRTCEEHDVVKENQNTEYSNSSTEMKN